MVHMNISALSMEEAELMLKVLDQWLRYFYNTAGVQRRTSFNRRANDGIRAQIRVMIDETMWEYVWHGVMTDAMHRLDKNISFHVERIGGLKVLELATEEATI